MRKLLMPVAWGCILSLVVAQIAHADENRPTSGDYKCYFGVLHSHCVLSPDFIPKVDRDQLNELLAGNGEERFSLKNGPMAAYVRAADDAKLDFLALTDHLHGPCGKGDEPCSHEMPEGGYRLLREAAERVNNDPKYKGQFLAISGMEWSTLSSANHVNIFFAEHPVPNWIDNGAFDDFRKEYLEDAHFEKGNDLLLVQMNHPNANDGKTSVNYGRRFFPDGSTGDTRFAKAFQEIYAGIEHIIQ